MKSPRIAFRLLTIKIVSLLLVVTLLSAPICAQRPGGSSKPPPARPADSRAPAPNFDNLLAADAYKMYGEVRNVGQLMTTGAVGEIIDPIVKLSDPPETFTSIIKFLKNNSEALAAARLQFATWPVRDDLPNVFVAIEFATDEEAAKFAPKLQTFLPTVLPTPTPEPTPETSGPATGSSGVIGQQPAMAKSKKENLALAQASPTPKTDSLPFVITHTGNLVLFSDKSFKLEKLHPAGTKTLFEDQNFRIAHDRFSSEPVFMFFNVALEEKHKPAPEKKQEVAVVETERMKPAEGDTEGSTNEADKSATPSPTPEEVNANEQTAVLMAGPVTTPSPTPTPTKEQQAQAMAGSQIGNMLDALGFGEPQWPDAVGLALALESNDYIIKAILIDPPDARKLPLPFVPQLISGPAYTSDAPSVLPDDTEVFVTASVDLLQTYDAMRKATEAKARAEVKQVEAGGNEPPLDVYAEFEKKGGIKIKDDLLPAFGNEIALAGTLKALQGVGINVAPTPPAKPSPEAGDGKDAKDDKEKKAEEAFPMLLISVRDREAARRLMPRILDGLGMGEASLIAQVEKREDTEMVNYAGIFAYAFVGNFVVISEAATVRKVIEANINHQTLSSNGAFRNSRRWEPARTLGQIYISPALMEAYHDEIKRQGASLDPSMRDFLLGLDPTATAITYALSSSGLGTEHEIHLPKNLILTTVAGISSATKNPPPEMNEGIAIGMLQMISSAESSYQATAGKGKYATLDELVKQNLISRESLDKNGYNFQISSMGDQFEAVATPREYGKTGKRSFFVDKSGVVRGDDHGGAPASVADKPIQ
jgi:hypothetical protein